MNVDNITVSYSTGKIKSKTNGWKLTDTLKEQIIQYAREDAKNNNYMGVKFQHLRKSEVAKVAPNRAALIGKLNQAVVSGNMGDLEKINEADKRWLCILFGIPYEAEFQSEGYGSAVHVYNENGEEVLTYTGGVGWHEKETKAETAVHSALKFTYYDAWQEAKNAIKANAKELVSADGEIVQESSFDYKA